MSLSLSASRNATQAKSQVQVRVMCGDFCWECGLQRHGVGVDGAVDQGGGVAGRDACGAWAVLNVRDGLR